MELTEVEKYLDKLFKKESYRELSAVSKENCLEDSPVEEAYNFDEISEYIFSSNKPASADALLIKNDKIYIATYSIIIFILASLFSKNNYILFNILKYYNYSNLFFFILIPLIAFTAFSMKSSKKA